MGDFWDAWWQQTYQVKSIVVGHVRTLRTMEVYLVSMQLYVPKSPVEPVCLLTALQTSTLQ